MPGLVRRRPFLGDFQGRFEFLLGGGILQLGKGQEESPDIVLLGDKESHRATDPLDASDGVFGQCETDLETKLGAVIGQASLADVAGEVYL